MSARPVLSLNPKTTVKLTGNRLPRFYVWLKGKNGGGEPTRTHRTLAEALAEADRLSIHRPGYGFRVLQEVAFRKVKKPKKSLQSPASLLDSRIETVGDKTPQSSECAHSTIQLPKQA